MEKSREQAEKCVQMERTGEKSRVLADHNSVTSVYHNRIYKWTEGYHSFQSRRNDGEDKEKRRDAGGGVLYRGTGKGYVCGL